MISTRNSRKRSTASRTIWCEEISPAASPEQLPGQEPVFFFYAAEQPLSAAEIPDDPDCRDAFDSPLFEDGGLLDNVPVYPSVHPVGGQIQNQIDRTINEYSSKEDVYIIGGASIYNQTLPYVDEVLLTKVNADGGAEVFFTNLDELDNFEIVNSSEPVMDGKLEIRFLTYRNNNKKRI